MTERTVTAYWLIPAKQERKLLHQIIRALCKKFDAPRFEAHLTLFVTSQDRRRSTEILRQIRSKPIRLKVRGIGLSSEFTKTLFIRFRPNKALEQLTADLSRISKSRPKCVSDLHLSLLYKSMSISAQNELARSIELPFSTVIFDSIKAVQCASPTRNRADVEAWRVLAAKSLAG